MTKSVTQEGNRIEPIYERSHCLNPYRIKLLIGSLPLLLLPMMSLVTEATAQTDTHHWMPPVWENRGSYERSLPVQMQIATEFASAEVTVSLADGTLVAKNTVRARQPWIVPLDAVKGMTFQANAIESDKGLLVHSNVPVRVYYQGVSRLNQFFVTLKGRHALGKEFWAGSQSLVRDSVGFDTEFGENDVHFISVMATEDNTKVKISAPGDVVLFGGERTVEVVLNKHQTYLVRNTSSKGENADNVKNNLTGSHIEADKPIAVVSGGQHLKLIDSKDAEAGIDQLVPLKGDGFYAIGRKYIVIKGSTQDISLVNPDYATIIGTQDQTDVYIDGSSVPVATINAGEYYNYILPGDAQDIGSPHYIETSKEAYVYHFSGIRRQEVGMVLVPSIECTGNNYIEYSKLGDSTYHNVVHIAAPREAFEDAAGLTINGQPYTDFDATVTPVPGQAGWATITFGEAASLSNRAPLPGTITVASSISFHLSILAGNEVGASYGYLAGFTASLEILDPRDFLPTEMYVVDTIGAGETHRHCLEIVSCDEESQITDVIESIYTGQAEKVAPRCLSYTAQKGYAGNDTLIVIVNNRADIPRLVRLIYHIEVLTEEECDALDISEGFSPNGDGNNDTWYIQGIACFPNNEVSVYNRWGGLVYHTIGYDNTVKRWNGVPTGGAVVGNRELPFGTYYYVINLRSEQPLYKGYLVIRP